MGLVNVTLGALAFWHTVVEPLIEAVGTGRTVTLTVLELAAVQGLLVTTARYHLLAVRAPI